jgi:DNA replication and repair protein RecF
VFISRLRLVNFRSYQDTTVEFAPGLNVIVGRNASGKTNLLEGAWFALRAASPRTNKDDKAVRWGAPFARAEATVMSGSAAGRDAASSDTGSAASPAVTASPARPGVGRSLTVAYAPGQGKQARVDGVEVRSIDDLRRQAPVFIFVPESLLLIKGSPARRRAHLDAFAAALDPSYDAGLRDLTTVLKQRNAQLLSVREGAPPDTLEPWDRQLARVGLGFEERRRTLVVRLAAMFSGFARALAPEGGEFSLSLVSQLDETSEEEAYVAALRARRGGEVARAVSGYGPHRDDLCFAEVVAGDDAASDDVAALRDLRLYGSQGEQRAAVLALLLAERAVAAEITGEVGALLLDDVMSELDDARRRLLVNTLTAGGQAIITTTNRLYFTADELARAAVVDIGSAPLPADAPRDVAPTGDPELGGEGTDD